MHANDYTIVRVANRQLLINTVYEFGPLTVMELSRRAHLSRPTVETLLRELVSEGVFAEVGTSKEGVGRSAKLYGIGVERYFSIGVDFEYPALRVCAVNFAERPVCSVMHRFEQTDTPRAIIARMKEMIADVMGRIPRPEDGRQIDLLGIGVGISGLIDRDTQTSISIERLQGWRDVRLADILRQEFNLPVYMQNDVHMLSLVRQKECFRRGISDYLYLSMRSGIGMAMFFKKKLLGGTQGNAGYFGHTTMDVNGPLCCCGNRGCLEIYLSPTQLITNYFFATQQRVEYKELLERFGNGDPAATETMRNAYNIFGKAISNVIKITDIQYLIINGMPEQQTARLIGWIHEGINSNTLPAVSGNVVIEAEKLEDTEALGAGIFVLRKFMANPKLSLAPQD